MRRKISLASVIISIILLLIIANAPIDNSKDASVTPKPEVTGSVLPKPKATKEASVLKPESTKIPYNTGNASSIAIDDIPSYKSSPYVIINGDVPFFTEKEITDVAFEYYSEQDKLGRCGMVWACIGQEIMPTEERGSIGHVRPAGWHTVKYDVIEGLYLYNRCHLIGYQLAGENDNVNNLITGTRYLNVVGMLPFENMVANYVENTNNHVMYRVTPIYEGDNLLANGVLMEAYSVEDGGEGLSFNVFVYNVQPGVKIDYATGESCKSD